MGRKENGPLAHFLFVSTMDCIGLHGLNNGSGSINFRYTSFALRARNTWIPINSIEADWSAGIIQIIGYLHDTSSGASYGTPGTLPLIPISRSDTTVHTVQCYNSAMTLINTPLKFQSNGTTLMQFGPYGLQCNSIEIWYW